MHNKEGYDIFIDRTIFIRIEKELYKMNKIGNGVNYVSMPCELIRTVNGLKEYLKHTFTHQIGTDDDPKHGVRYSLYSRKEVGGFSITNGEPVRNGRSRYGDYLKPLQII